MNTALRVCTPEQRAVLDANYGQKDSQKETVCKKLFKELKIDELYYQYEEKVVSEIRAEISRIDESRGLKSEVLTAFLNKIYKRQK